MTPSSTASSLTLVSSLTAALALTASPAFADDYVIELSPTYTYGHNDQNYPNNNFGDQACAPTSTVNSFLYVQSRFGVNLVPHVSGNTAADDASAAINELGADMGTNATGTSDGNMVAGKKKYIADHGLSSKISVEVEAENASADPTQTTPTWQFLFDQLSKGQDVEFGFNWGLTTGHGGHWITVTGLDFNDTNDDQTIQFGEATLSFIDPWGGVPLTGNLTMGGPGGNRIVLSYSGGAADNPQDPDNPTDTNLGYADIIVAESVPEPSTLLLLSFALCASVVRRPIQPARAHHHTSP